MKGVQLLLCPPLFGPVYWIIHQYNRCLFLLSPHLCIIWSENLLMRCVPGSCETNLKLHIKIWCLLKSSLTHTDAQRVWCLPFVRDGETPQTLQVIIRLVWITAGRRSRRFHHRWESVETNNNVSTTPSRALFTKCIWFEGREFIPHADIYCSNNIISPSRCCGNVCGVLWTRQVHKLSHKNCNCGETYNFCLPVLFHTIFKTNP